MEVPVALFQPYRLATANDTSDHQYLDIKTSIRYLMSMRTTLTIDDDVAVMLERLRKQREGRFKDVVNEALRRGLKDMDARPKPRKPFRTPTMDLGRPLIDVSNVAEAIAIAEGEDYK